MSLAKPASELAAPTGQIVRFAFSRARGRTAITTVIAEAFRSAALSALLTATGSRRSFLLSGHRSDDRPDDQHRHAYYLPQFDHEELVGLLVASPYDRFASQEMEALRKIRKLQWGGPSTRCDVELVEEDDLSVRTVGANWKTLTPYVPLRRFWGSHGKRHLVPQNQLRAELETLAVQAIISSLEMTYPITVRVRIPPGAATTSPQRRLAFSVQLTLSTPICGPLCLGHSSHFGLGLFVPVSSQYT
jgi:CRISPR-associated protein Csb2